MSDTKKLHEISISQSFLPCLQNKDRFLVMVGGAGSGKSEFAARKIIARCLSELGHRFLVMRKVSATLDNSVVQLIKDILDNENIPYQYQIQAKILHLNGNTILFKGLDDREKLKSITHITSIWLEELSEFTHEDFMQINMRLRGETKYYKQIMCTSNPVMCWIKGYFFDKKVENAFTHHSTVDDNPFIDPEYKSEVLDKIPDDTYYKIYRLGLWAVAKGLVYGAEHFKFCTEEPKEYEEIIYGLDFGHNHPTSLVQIGIIDGVYYIKELIYKSGLVIADIESLMRDLIPKENMNKTIYCDTQGSDKIETLCRAGFNAVKSNKKVEAGISYVKGLETYLVSPCSNIQNELKKYKWKEDKEGNPLDEPVKLWDDGLDSIRYALYTYNQHEVKKVSTWL